MKEFSTGKMKNLTKKKTVALTSAVLLASTIGATAVFAAQDDVTLVVDGQETTVTTLSSTLEGLLEKEGVSVTKEDFISKQLHTKIKDDMTVEIRTNKDVTLRVDDQIMKVSSTASTIEDVLKENNIEVTEHDQLNVELLAKIKEGQEIVIQKAFPIQLKNGKEKGTVWTVATTVSELLTTNGIELGKDDKVQPLLNEKLTEESNVTIQRIKKEKSVVEETLAFKTIEKEDDSIEKGKKVVVQEGKEGKVENEYEITYVNGELHEKEKKNENILEPSKNKIIAIGTKEAPKPVTVSTSLPSRGEDVVKGEYYVEATAYSADCAGCSGFTATGFNLAANPNAKVIAVDPRVIPLGTRVYVEGYGYAIAADTGGAIKGKKIDVFINDANQVRNWGRRTVKIKILGK